MGQSASTCSNLSDQEVLNLVKQYFTINKMIEILVDVEDNKLSSLEPATKFLVDITRLLPDGVSPENTIYKPVMTLIGIADGQKKEIPYTALHKYNDFILTESPLMSPNDRKVRAKEIRGELFGVSQRLLDYITGFCGYVGLPIEE